MDEDTREALVKAAGLLSCAMDALGEVRAQEFSRRCTSIHNEMFHALERLNKMIERIDALG